MARARKRTEHAGAKNGGGSWERRAEAKRGSAKLRREVDRQESAAQREVEPNDVVKVNGARLPVAVPAMTTPRTSVHARRSSSRGAHQHGPEPEGREITPSELAHWRATGEWPEGVRSLDHVTLTDDELQGLADTGTWPARLG